MARKNFSMSDAQSWNTKLVTLFGCAMAVYLIYEIITHVAHSSEERDMLTFSTWKTRDFINIPEDIINKAKLIKPKEIQHQFTFSGKVTVIHKFCNII